MNSLRHRLTLLLLTGSMVVMVGGGLVLYLAVHRILVGGFDYALLAKAQALTSLSERERHGVSLRFTEMALPEFQSGPDAEYFQVWLNDGTSLAKSPSLGSSDLPFPSATRAMNHSQDLPLPDGRPGRAVTLGLFADDENPSALPAFFLVFARGREHLDRALVQLLGGLVAGGLGCLGLSGWLTQRAVRSGLGPVNDLALQVTGVSAESLDTRFGLAGLPSELKPIAAQLNALLDRLRAAFEREKRFSANAAHELATPISELRALAEISLRLPRDPDIHLANNALEISKHMQCIVDTLRTLARHETGLLQSSSTTVNLTALLEEISAALAPRLTEKGICWTLAAPANMVLRSDPTLLRCMVSNLLENAVEYTPAQGKIICQVEGTDGTSPTLRITNTNPGLTPEDLPFLFEPWWRKDAARSDQTHTGLGLSLVKACADHLGCCLETRLSPEGSVQFELLFNPADSPDGSPRLPS